MKHPLIPIVPDKVTISEQGRAASRKWQAGDKSFVRFLDEAEASSTESETAEVRADTEQIDPIGRIDEDEGSEWNALARKTAHPLRNENGLMLDIGSRLELDRFPEVNSFIIRSTTRIHLGDAPHACETHWEILHEE